MVWGLDDISLLSWELMVCYLHQNIKLCMKLIYKPVLHDTHLKDCKINKITYTSKLILVLFLFFILLFCSYFGVNHFENIF